MDYRYLVPANSKKQNLILGFLTFVDLMILITGIAITLVLLIIVNPQTIGLGIITILPFLVAGFLVFPIPNYHNSRILIMEIYNFYFVKRRRYIWRGWCYKYEQSDE